MCMYACVSVNLKCIDIGISIDASNSNIGKYWYASVKLVNHLYLVYNLYTVYIDIRTNFQGM